MRFKKHSLEKHSHQSGDGDREFKKKKLPEEDEISKPEVATTHHEKNTHGHTIAKHHEEDTIPKSEKSRIDKELQQIYENSDGTLPDMQTFEKRERNRVASAFVFLLAACVFLGGVAWAGFFWFQPEVQFQEQKVVLSVSGEENVTIGTPVTYRVRYRNDQRIPLAKASIQARYPEGFVFVSSTVPASTDKKDEWDLGSLPEGGSGFIDITGIVNGDFNSEKSIRVFLNYTPANVSAEFQKVATASVKLSRSPVELTIETPKDIVSGKEYQTIFKMSQKSDLKDTQLMLVVEPADGFNKKKSAPESDNFSPYKWTIPMGNKDFTVTLDGLWSGGEVAKIKAKIVAQKKNISGNQYVFVTSEAESAVVEKKISAKIVVNGSVSGTIFVAPGELMHATLVVENNGSTPIKNVRLRAIFDAPSIKNKSIFAWQELQDEKNGVVTGEQIDSSTRRGSIVWDKQQIGALKEILPGKEVSVDFTLPVKGADDTVLADLAGKQVQILVRPETQYDESDRKEIFGGVGPVLILGSDTSLTVSNSVNEQGNYVITWSLANSYHELKNVHLEADIYGDITWVENMLKVPAGKAVFDAEKKKLVWDIESMPLTVDVLPLQFAVRLNKDNLTQKELVSKVRGKATDSVNSLDIIISGESVPLHP